MTLDWKRYDDISLLVANLFQRLEINSVPINPFEIAALLRIGIVSYSSLPNRAQELAILESEDGFSFLTDHGWIIFYNDRKTFERIRFTISHEIGHILLDHSQASDLAESEANHLARYLLAPPVLVQFVAHLGIGQVADFFLIGLEAASNALRQASNRWQYGKLFFSDADQQIFALFKTDDTEEGRYGIREKKPS